MRRDISVDHPDAVSTDDIAGDILTLDAIVVGAGFGGTYMLKHLRDDLGMKVKIFEAGSDIGGMYIYKATTNSSLTFWEKVSGIGIATRRTIFPLIILSTTDMRYRGARVDSDVPVLFNNTLPTRGKAITSMYANSKHRSMNSLMRRSGALGHGRNVSRATKN